MEGSQGTANYSALMRPFHGHKYSTEAEGRDGALGFLLGERSETQARREPGECHRGDLGGRGDEKAEMGPAWAGRVLRFSRSDPGTRQCGRDTQMCAGTDRCVLGRTRSGPCEIKPIPGHEHPDDSGHSCHPFVSSNSGDAAHPCHHSLGEGSQFPLGDLFLFPMRGNIS